MRLHAAASVAVPATLLLFFLSSRVQGQSGDKVHHNLPDDVELVDPKSLGLSAEDLEKFLGNVKVLPFQPNTPSNGGPKTQILTVGFEGDEQLNLDDFEIPGLNTPNAGGMPEGDREIAQQAFNQFKDYFRTQNQGGQDGNVANAQIISTPRQGLLDLDGMASTEQPRNVHHHNHNHNSAHAGTGPEKPHKKPNRNLSNRYISQMQRFQRPTAAPTTTTQGPAPPVYQQHQFPHHQQTYQQNAHHSTLRPQVFATPQQQQVYVNQQTHQQVNVQRHQQHQQNYVQVPQGHAHAQQQQYPQVYETRNPSTAQNQIFSNFQQNKQQHYAGQQGQGEGAEFPADYGKKVNGGSQPLRAAGPAGPVPKVVRNQLALEKEQKHRFQQQQQQQQSPNPGLQSFHGQFAAPAQMQKNFNPVTSSGPTVKPAGASGFDVTPSMPMTLLSTNENAIPSPSFYEGPHPQGQGPYRAPVYQGTFNNGQGQMFVSQLRGPQPQGPPPPPGKFQQEQLVASTTQRFPDFGRGAGLGQGPALGSQPLYYPGVGPKPVSGHVAQASRQHAFRHPFGRERRARFTRLIPLFHPHHPRMRKPPPIPLGVSVPIVSSPVQSTTQ